MLNLVQLQERLKGIPMQALMQYANGASPQVPPFLALGELNRRKKMQEAAAAEQAQEMAGAPSIKEQIEQATGFMAAQPPQQQAPQEQPVQMAEGGTARVPLGLARLPIRRDMFNRRDYAGGGIVAFENGGSVFNRVDTSETMSKKSGQYLDLLKRLFGGRDEETDPADPTSMMGTAPSAEARDLASVKDERDEEKKRRDEMRRRVEAQQRIFADLLSGRRPVPRRSNDPELMAERRPAGLPTLARDSGAEEFPAAAVPRERGETTGIESLMRPDMTMEQRLEEVRRLNKLAGRDPNFMSEYEKRIAAIEARRAQERESEPMDKLAAFLTGIAGSRRGAKFGEAGAAGVSASMKLAAEQKALRDRQELDMAQLRLSVAREKDALAKGDLDTARSEQKEQDRLKLDLFKAQSEDQYRKEQVAAQKSRLAFDQSQSNSLRQMEIVRKYMDDLRTSLSKNNTKYLNNTDLLEAEVLARTKRAFGEERLAELGLFSGVPAQAAPSGNRPPLSSFNK